MNDILCQHGEELVRRLNEEEITRTKPGSGSYLLFGSRPSPQSLNIKFGRAFEKWFHQAVILGNNDYEMMKCGVWREIQKDLDLIFRDNQNKVIYYRELKCNIDLDTEKIVSTYEKVLYIQDHLRVKFPEYRIDVAILAWATYDKEKITAQSKIKKCHDNKVQVEVPRSFFDLININISEKEYLDYFKHIGKCIEGGSK